MKYLYYKSSPMKIPASIRSFLLVLLLTGSSGIANAQSDEIEKKFARADKLYQDYKDDEAEKILLELAEKYPYNPNVWNKLVGMQLNIYENKKKHEKLMSNIQITTKDPKGNVIEDDSLANELLKLLSNIKPSDNYLNHIINTCRKACCLRRDAFHASMTIRMHKVDGKIDANVNPKAKEQFDLAEKEFQKENFNSAAKYYQKAIELDSTYYKAKLYLGDVYYATKHYNLAIEAFKKAIATRPDLVEPRKYLVDALANSDAYEKAYAAAIEGVLVYPDYSMMQKLEDAAMLSKIKCDLHWTGRDVFPNRMKEVKPGDDDPLLKPAENSPWKHYKQAQEKIKQHCSENGIISSNSITKQKYLEAYSWEYMLGKSSAKELEFARKMKEKGFLDCYALISCFHYDFYDQFKDLVSNNREKVMKYFEMLREID